MLDRSKGWARVRGGSYQKRAVVRMGESCRVALEFAESFRAEKDVENRG